MILHKFCTIFVIVSMLIPQVSCITVAESEKQAVHISAENRRETKQVTVGALQANYLVYNPSRWPLEDFFGELMSGDLLKAVESFNVKYEFSNTDSEALETLMDNGYVPVYVRLKNRAKVPLAYSEKSVRLRTNTDTCILPLIAKDSPKWFEEVNLAAIGANISNVVVISFAVLILVAGASSGSRIGSGSNFGNVKGKVINDTTKTKHIDYRNFLISSGILQPGEIREGLVFFHPKESFAWDEIELTSADCAL